MEKAEVYFKRAMDAWKKVPAYETHSHYGYFLTSLAAFYKETGREEEARKIEERAKDVKSKVKD